MRAGDPLLAAVFGELAYVLELLVGQSFEVFFSRDGEPVPDFVALKSPLFGEVAKVLDVCNESGV